MFKKCALFLTIAVPFCYSYTLNFVPPFQDCGTNVNIWSMELTPMPHCYVGSEGGSSCNIVLHQTYVGTINFTADREFGAAYNYASAKFGVVEQEIFMTRDACRTPEHPTGTDCPIRPGVNQMYEGSITVNFTNTKTRQVGKWEVLSREDDHSKGSTIMCFVFPAVIVDPPA